MLAPSEATSTRGDVVTSVWCRACGEAAAGNVLYCGSCGAATAQPRLGESRVGLVYEVRGRLGLGRKLGVCVKDDEDAVQLHVSSKEKALSRVTTEALPDPDPSVSTDLSPTMRLVCASRLPLGDRKSEWDLDLVLAKAADCLGDLPTRRRVHDEALVLGWTDVADWVGLSQTERAWRAAHMAAAAGDVVSMRSHLAALPPRGYPDRVGLLLPFADRVSSDPESWQALLSDWCREGLDGAAELRDLCFGTWEAGLQSGLALLPEDRVLKDRWQAVSEEMKAGGPLTHPAESGCSSWSAAVAYQRGVTRRSLDAELSSVLALDEALLDDLVDAGALGEVDLVEQQSGSGRDLVLARLAPIRLDDDQLKDVGHHAELARRYMLRGDRSGLLTLPETPDVAHYLALLVFKSDGVLDGDRLRPGVREHLLMPERVLAAVKAGETRVLPPQLVEDPTVWSLFADVARSGALRAGADESARSRLLEQWIDLQRLLGLVWEGELAQAADDGVRLAERSTDERTQDEALNLAAFALDQLGRSDEAVRLLEQALEGSYTQHLLINTSIAASHADPAMASTLFARIVREAPNPELRLAALRRALEVWSQTDLKFPAALETPLRSVLAQDLTLDDLAFYGGVAVVNTPEILVSTSSRTGEPNDLLRLLKARARFQCQETYGSDDLARDFVAVFRSVGRPEWFDDQWNSLVRLVRNSVLVDLGEAIGSAQFIDAVIETAPELFTLEDRLVLAALAGGHLAAALDADDSYLAEGAMQKFFVVPIEEFLVARHKLDPGIADMIAENFSRCFFVAILGFLTNCRNELAAEYNALNERARWDADNRLAIHSQQFTTLANAERSTHAVERLNDRLVRLGLTSVDGARRPTAIAGELGMPGATRS